MVASNTHGKNAVSGLSKSWSLCPSLPLTEDLESLIFTIESTFANTDLNVSIFIIKNSLSNP